MSADRNARLWNGSFTWPMASKIAAMASALVPYFSCNARHSANSELFSNPGGVSGTGAGAAGAAICGGAVAGGICFAGDARR